MDVDYLQKHLYSSLVKLKRHLTLQIKIIYAIHLKFRIQKDVKGQPKDLHLRTVESLLFMKQSQLKTEGQNSLLLFLQ
jgi:hypothetical protein